ncbi:nuclear transport factor 2 family protein [Nocardia speluncae]|uniref:Nuclear transport factor 2 family protein n=1 Tax=Nocardia speluncae TaxID=419477 RepID=A0A846XSL8_9NOCA|nr:nuclear transport factor 2 family protein [Nocardia speluncae]NKY37483.1 nuclear transport factor 2 family protein [Nocardia speluncae]
MAVRKLAEKYYELIDSGRLAEAAALMTDDVKLTFANAEPVTGRDAATASIQYVLDQTTKIEHKVVHWIEPHPATDGTTEVMFEIRIHYWLKSGKELDIPGAVYATVNADNMITEQRLYGDLTEVFAG